MVRVLRLLGVICVTFLFGMPVPAEAWTTPGWSNHRKIHVQVANNSGMTVSVSADGYHCQNRKMLPFVVVSGGTGQSQFEWGFERTECSTTPFVVITVGPQGSPKVACRISAYVVGLSTTSTTPTHWRAYGDQFPNCTWGIAGPDGKIPPAQDNLFITLKPRVILYTPDAPRSAFRSSQCRPLYSFPQQCSYDLKDMKEFCVPADCRQCRDQYAYRFVYKWTGDDPTNIDGVCPVKQ